MGGGAVRHMVFDELEATRIVNPDSAHQRIAQDRRRIRVGDARVTHGNGCERAARVVLSLVEGDAFNVAETDASLRKAGRDCHLREAVGVLDAAQSFFLDGRNDHTVLE